ncbi:hypothetical protein [Acinetobacter nosocomialis]|uniref:hypothetical protein n=1 Tax=Acinetobacter nosocomialis TaxID=106654 RepID=UPI000DE78250|nr:hypothetical protein [Acinetobacter nosocomialis]RSN87034.1 hypothetical protein EA768_05875 [Acinetobacter nosocomialis]SSO19597.1 Uncharacterised protein [Acinetobacter nosocomialis]SSQ78657.1 Uncharacterised protein [Acinetobacter nosocomialis]
MAQHLTDQNVQDIVEILDYWSPNEKLTWERLCKAIEVQLELVPAPTRQTLQKFARIKNAYDQGKKSPAALKILKAKQQKLPASLKIAQVKIDGLETKIERLEKENSMLLEQFVIWQYNAYKYGISIEQLNEPLNKQNL